MLRDALSEPELKFLVLNTLLVVAHQMPRLKPMHLDRLTQSFELCFIRLHLSSRTARVISALNHEEGRFDLSGVGDGRCGSMSTLR